MVRQIELTQYQVTQVDDEDYDWLSEVKWCANFYSGYSGGGKFLAVKTKQNKTMLMHRVIMERILNRKLGRRELIDHIDGDPLNNTRENLRVATHAQNGMNSRISSNNTSGFKGVSWYEKLGKWSAYICPNNSKIHLGYFATAELASEAYEAAAKEFYGEYRRK